MSQHRSLKTNKFKVIRSVRSRRERVEKLIRNLEWMEKNQSVYNLPKEKIVRIKYKIKKALEKKDTPLTPTPPITT